MRSLVNSFSIIHRQSAIMLERKLRMLDITFGQFMIIMAVSENETISQEKVATLLRIDKGAVARTVQKLLQVGYIRREVSEEDRRQYKLYATEKAHALRADMIAIADEWEETLTGALTGIEAELLRSLLDKIVDSLGTPTDAAR